MLIILYLGGVFVPGKLPFFERNLRIGSSVETCVCSFQFYSVS